MRNKYSRLVGLGLALALVSRAFAAEPKSLPLDGQWRLQLDRADAGLAESWFDRKFAGPGQVAGRIDARMDLNADGDWNDAGKQIFADLPVRNGVTNANFSVPGSAVGGPTFARFRLSANGKLRPEGPAANGEVEDYQVNVAAALDFGDAPAPYPTLLAQNGARHGFTNEFCLGTKVDGDVNGQPNADATGDDLNPSTSDDEDGVTFTSGIVPGQSASVQVLVTGGAAGGPWRTVVSGVNSYLAPTSTLSNAFLRGRY